jgi:phosphate transport system permease protein
MFRRKLEEKIFYWLMKAAAFLVAAFLLMILGVIFWKGLPSMSWEMISETPHGGFYLGREGGILNAIIGSLYIGGGATLLAFVLGLPVVIYINIYASSQSWLSWFTRTCMDILWGIPSIVFGAFGFIIMLFIGMKVSVLAGIIILSFLILPIIVRAMDEVIRSIPSELYDASLSLGATKWETARKIMMRKALPGIITAILLAFGRAIGDAASVMFTAGFTDNIPRSLDEPAATLPLAIFFQLSSPIPEVRERAYSAALILTFIVLLISFTIRAISKKYMKHSIS